MILLALFQLIEMLICIINFFQFEKKSALKFGLCELTFRNLFIYMYVSVLKGHSKPIAQTSDLVLKCVCIENLATFTFADLKCH